MSVSFPERLLWAVAALSLSACSGRDGLGIPMPADLAPTPSSQPVESGPEIRMRFAVIGDFGVDTPDESHVASLVKRQHPDFIITVGDNNYPDGDQATIDQNIGEYYSAYIGSYTGTHGTGSPVNRFWPTLGNHDWYSMNGDQPYLDYFPSLPGNRRYYDVVMGAIHFFALDADGHEPDGNTVDSVQAQWLHETLSQSTSCFNIVYFHQPPFSSGPPQFVEPEMNWPFREWGADLVLSGHQHHYERLMIDHIPYVVDGLGGALNRFEFAAPVPGSLVRYNDDFGALFADVSDNQIYFRFRDTRGEVIDAFTVDKSCTVRDGGAPADLTAS